MSRGIWAGIVLGWIAAAWMVFDGSRALVKGSYVTASSGPRAGQLGPWASIVRAASIDPNGTPVKIVLVVLGGAWLAASAAFLLGAPWGRTALFAAAAAALWYLPFGTLAALVQIGLLIWLR